MEAVASSTFYIVQVLEQGGTASPHTTVPLSSCPSHVPSALFSYKAWLLDLKEKMES